MKKVLMVSSVASMIEQFNLDNISILQNLGYQVSVATNFIEPGTITKENAETLKNNLESQGVECYQIDFPRGVGTMAKNKHVLQQLTKLADKQFDLLHCHSPIGGVLSRWVFKDYDTKIIYTAHGFQFYKGGSKKDWLIFYPIEKYFSRFTDLILTINKEDETLAKNKFNSKVRHIPGVGIEHEKIQNVMQNKNMINELKEKLNLTNRDKIMISIGELSDRKNHIAGIEAMKKLNDNHLHYVICGIGDKENELKEKAIQYNLNDNVHFMGYTKNIADFLVYADFSLFLSKREGLGLAGLEAMAAGLPLISSYTGGIKDYTENEITGYTVNNPNDYGEVADKINKLMNNDNIDLKKISEKNQSVSRNYSKNVVNMEMKDIYSSFL